MQAAPQPQLKNEWPRYLARAALAAGEGDAARQQVTALIRNPGRYWAQADTTGPGFIRWAIGLGGYGSLPEPDQRMTDALRRVLHD